MRLVSVWILPLLAATTPAQQPYKPSPKDLAAAYERADALPRLATNTVFNLTLRPNWFGGHYLWYRKDLKDKVKAFVLVDAALGTKKPAFDHARLAKALTDELGKPVEADRLPFDSIKFDESMGSITFTSGVSTWKCDLTTYLLTKAAAEPGTPGQRQTRPGPTPTSPDGKWTASVKDGKLEIRDKAGTVVLTSTKADMMGPEWSPDSKKLVAFHVLPGDRKPVFLVQSTPRDGGRAKLLQRPYDLPGDKLDAYVPVVFDPVAKTEVTSDVEPITTSGAPWNDPPGATWRKGSASLVVEFATRGYQSYQVVDIDPATGKHRVWINEQSKTFVDVGSIISRYLTKSEDVIWRSERDGWGHLYLIGPDGTVKNQITKGEWVVRSVQRVDEDKKEIVFTANGRDKGQDPYLVHSYRVSFDGTGLVDLTPGDGNHTVDWAPGGTYYTDTSSRVDSPPVHELRRGSDGTLIAVLEKADVSEFAKTGVRPMEVFVAKGRDGITDIWGVVCRPTKFDPKKKYPVIENIYAGPQDSFVPKSYRATNRMQQLAELGFIVVQCDGMGTRNRGKAFHDVCYKNIADAGFPDRILWMKALAKKYPYVDVGKVGVYGTSAGGQNSTAALLFHPEFYKAAVSSCGCHDNRMDKVWWNEQWMGYPVGLQYAEQSNITNAKLLKGNLLLMVGELDTNVPPESTMRLVDALIKANKDFDFLVLPGMDHTDGGVYGERKRRDFFVRHLLGGQPPDWNSLERPVPASDANRAEQ